MDLFINTPGTAIRQKDGLFLFTAGENKKEIAPSRLSRIVMSPSTVVTGQAIVLAQENNIDLVILNHFGEPVGRFWHSKLGRVAVIRRRQLEAATEKLGLKVAEEFVKVKLSNQASFIKKLAQKRPRIKSDLWERAEAILDLRQKIDQPQRGTLIEEKRNFIIGLEGMAGRTFFGGLTKVMPDGFKFDGRSRRPARDPFNAALNYCYGVMYSLVEQACILAGLDPFVGFVHADNYGQPSLVFDLIEPFRIYAEAPCVSLFTGRHIKEEFFDFSPEAVTLNPSGKSIVVQSLNGHLDQKIQYRRRTLKRFNVIRQEAHRLAAFLYSGDDQAQMVDVEEF